MRMFRRADLNDADMPLYSCQQDGMLGLGAGARSYTQRLHYSSEYAVGRHGVKAIIDHYHSQSQEDFSAARYGIVLSEEEQRRRFVIQSLLIADGLDRVAYQQRFRQDCMADFPALQLLTERGLARQTDISLILTEAGVERADSIGPWLTSAAVRQAMHGYQMA